MLEGQTRLPKPQMADKYQDELDNVLTIQECMIVFEKSYSGVLLAIQSGRLYAVKKDAPEGKMAGVWVISFSSARDLWGQTPEPEELPNHDTI